MKNLIAKIDETLLSLMIGIIIFGLVSQLVGMWFVDSIFKYTTGLWCGVVLALLCAWHMWWTLDKNLTVNADNELGARAYSTKNNLIRYAVIVVVFAILCLTDFCYPLAAFLGVMGLKIGAYMAPLISKLMNK